jgi:hypothetical protein
VALVATGFVYLGNALLAPDPGFVRDQTLFGFLILSAALLLPGWHIATTIADGKSVDCGDLPVPDDGLGEPQYRDDCDDV